MDYISSCLSYSKCRPDISASGELVAHIAATRLVIRDATTLASKHVVDLGIEFASQIVNLCWDRYAYGSQDQRLAVNSRDEVRTFAITNEYCEEIATIYPGRLGVSQVQWLTTARNTMLAVSASIKRLQTSIWTDDGVMYKIINPKSILAHCIAPGLFAFASRANNKDTIAIIDCNSLAPQQLHEIQLEVFSPNAIKWSRSGMWVVVAENPVLSTRVDLYDALNGNRMLSYMKSNPSSKSADTDDLVADIEVGFTCVECGICPTTQEEYVLLGDSRGMLTLLNFFTFTRAQSVVFHGNIYSSSACVWKYQDNGFDIPSYALKLTPFMIVGADSHGTSQLAVTSMTLSDDCRYLATMTCNNTIWVWDMSIPIKIRLLAVLHHDSRLTTIKEIKWTKRNEKKLENLRARTAEVTDFGHHKLRSSTLAIILSNSTRLCLWNTLSQEPVVVETGLDSRVIGCQWVGSQQRLLLWSMRQFAVWSKPEEEDYEEEINMVINKENELVHSAPEVRSKCNPEESTETGSEPGTDGGGTTEDARLDVNFDNPDDSISVSDLEDDDDDNDDDDEGSREELVNTTLVLLGQHRSSAVLQDEETRVRDVINGHQQADWVEMPSTLESTFAEN